MIQKKNNNRPRQKLNFETQKRVLQKNIVILHLLVDSTDQVIKLANLQKIYLSLIFNSYIQWKITKSTKRSIQKEASGIP